MHLTMRGATSMSMKIEDNLQVNSSFRASIKELRPVWSHKSDSPDIPVADNQDSTDLEALASLQDKVASLQQELLDLVGEHDHLRYVICVNIENDYMLKMGYLEVKAFELQLTFSRMRREISMIQTCINRGEPVQLTVIQERLDSEFASFQAKLREQLNQLDSALGRAKADCLSEEEMKELKQLYRQLVKAWHPDMNPNLGPEYAQLFERAVQAYRNGDLVTMRILAVIQGGQDPEVNREATDSLSYWQTKFEETKDLIANYRERMVAIRQSYPYLYLEILEDDERLRERQEEYEELIQQYEANIVSYRQRLDALHKMARQGGGILE